MKNQWDEGEVSQIWGLWVPVMYQESYWELGNDYYHCDFAFFIYRERQQQEEELNEFVRDVFPDLHSQLETVNFC